MIDRYIAAHVREIQTKYTALSKMKDFEAFTLMCMKYFFFSGQDIPFDIDMALHAFTDGANDGGIDAIFNDPESENNDVIIVQCKYYDKTVFTRDVVAVAISKIETTLTDLENNRITGYNSQLVEAYRDAFSQKAPDGQVKIFFFTTYRPENKRKANAIESAAKRSQYSIEIIYDQDIQDQIDIIDNGKTYVEHDSLQIDHEDNVLYYENSVIVNISAQSLSDLYSRRKNGLLGMNLRYYVREKKVDEGIQKTIDSEPENFWYKNNGIVIVCEDFKISGCLVYLDKFSIINGGQTTNRIGTLEIKQDFYLQCKIIKVPNIENDQQGRFIISIAEATNAQKPIRAADLKANKVEQINLKKAFWSYHVYYSIKKGEKIPREFNSHYEIIKIDKVGKLSLAGIMQMPGSVRNNSSIMYRPEYYSLIFTKEAKAGIIADLLRLEYYYKKFRSSNMKDKGYNAEEVSLLRNASTFQLACITFLGKIEQNVFTYDQVSEKIKDQEKLKKLLRGTGEMKQLITHRPPTEDEEIALCNQLFNIIGDEVLCAGFEEAQYRDSTQVPQNFLKRDNFYYQLIIPRLWKKYKQNHQLHDLIHQLCGLNK